MQIIHKNLKKGILKVKIENLDDLWYLSQVIDSGDIVKGKTIRKIKLGDGSDRNVKVIKKSIFIGISVVKIEFHKYSNILRVSGKIIIGPEDVSKGKHHTFNLEPGIIFTIEKNKFLKYQIEKIKEAVKGDKTKILICVFDREDAFFAISKKYGYELLSSVQGEVAKKDQKITITKSFYKEIIKQIEAYDKRYNPSNIVIASPAFWKEDLMKESISSDVKKKIVLATCSSVKEDAINEVLRRQEVQAVLKQDRIAKEVNLVEELLTEISKEGKAVYGLRETKKIAESGAIIKLLITDKFIHKKRQEERFYSVEKIMKLVDNMQGNIFIISSDHEAGKKLDGLGGIGGLLRYKISY